MYAANEIARTVDLACLAPTATKQDVAVCCQKAIRYGCASVCVKPYHVAFANMLLKGYPVKAGTVVSFPHGNDAPHVKQAACAQAIEDGAAEVDMVLNIAAILEREWGSVAADVRRASAECKQAGVLLKTIIESACLTDALIVSSSGLAAHYGADFVKTSTGYGPGSATVSAVQLMLGAVQGTDCKVKASGGIKTYEDARKFLDLGCARLGSSRIAELLPPGDSG